MKWNIKLAAEYRESAAVIQKQIARLDIEIKAHAKARGAHDGTGLNLINRRYELRKILLDLTTTAYKLEHYYDKNINCDPIALKLRNSISTK